jgi:hypothetical protein
MSQYLIIIVEKIPGKDVVKHIHQLVQALSLQKWKWPAFMMET